MAYFPFFVDIEGQSCLIVGGGNVAFRKVQVLDAYGPAILVVSPVMCEEMAAYGAEHSSVTLEYRELTDQDLEEVDFVVCATEHEAVNRHVSELCRERRLPVNVVDVKEECSFIFPAIVRDGDITVGISTGGSSPAIAQMVKARVKAAVPQGFGELAGLLGTYRGLVKEKVDDQRLRADIFHRMAETGIHNAGRLDREQVESLIEEALSECRQLVKRKVQ